MKTLQRRNFQSFFAGLTILSVTFTQVIPAWALRPGAGLDNPTGPVRAGLEERLVTDAAQSRMDPLVVTRLAFRRLRQDGAYQDPKVSPGEIPPSALIAALWAGLTELPEGEKTLSGKVKGALDILQAFQTPGTVRAWDNSAVAAEVDRIASHAPGVCATCAAAGLFSIASSRQFQLKESAQSLAFRDIETVTALLIAMDVWLTGKVHSAAADTEHQVFANTLASSQAVYQAAELGVEPEDAREWTSRVMDIHQLREAISQGPVVVQINNNHFVHVARSERDHVVLSEGAMTAGGLPATAEVRLSWIDFVKRWAQPNGTGYGLVATSKQVHEIPGRQLALMNAKLILGSCGVSNASGVDGLFSRSVASQRIVRVLESRGFDNYANARKMSIELPADFNLQDERYAGLRQRIEEAARKNKYDVILIPGTAAKPPVLRFFAITRGVGSNVANARHIDTEANRTVTEIAELVFGKGVTVEQVRSTGRFDVMRGILRIGEVREEAAADHTRFKTKGGDRAPNAHHWAWKGVSGGINGDDEYFAIWKALLVEDHDETFEGETDSEVNVHLIGNLQENKDERGRVTSHVSSEQAVIRFFRLIENGAALIQASVVLQPGYGTDDTRRKEQEAVRKALEGMDIPASKVAETELVQGQPVPIFLREFFNWAISDPERLDRIATEGNGWNGYYDRLSIRLPQTKEKHFDNPKALNISLNLLSLWDDHSAVVARTYDKSTAFSFGFGRNDETGDVQMVLGGSELRGFAPLIGKPQESVPIRDGIVDMVNGSVEQLRAKEWSVYTVDQTSVTRHDVWTGQKEENLSGSDIRVKWTSVRPGQEAKYSEWTAFKLETTAQPITLYLTLAALTATDESGARTVRLAEATDRPGDAAKRLNDALANPNTKVFGGASGTSYHALLKTDASYNIFDGLQSSDLWLSTLIRDQIMYEVAQGRPPVFVIVSQSGETGAAINLAKELIKLGAIVIGVTNRPGSSIYVTTKESGGIVVTESLDETAVAATGSNSSQVAALELLAMKRREALTPGLKRTEIKRVHSQRISELVGLTTYLTPNGDASSKHAGALQGILDGFNPGQPNYRAVEALVAWLKDLPAKGEDGSVVADREGFRNLNLVLTGMGPVALAVAPENALKIMEVTRKMAAYVPLQELLAYKIADSNPLGRFEAFNSNGAVGTVEENLKRYTTGGQDFIGKYPHFSSLARNDKRLRDASEILLLGDGEAQVNLDYIVAKYQTVAPVPVKKKLYASAPPQVRAGSLVIAVQPWSQEQAQLLELYKQMGANVIILTSPQSGLPFHEPLISKARQEGALIEAAGSDWMFGQAVVLDLFMMRALEALHLRIVDEKKELASKGLLEKSPLKNVSTDYAEAAFQAQEVQHIQEQAGGMRQVADSFDATRSGGRHRNAVTLKRLQNYYKDRGWDRFDWWATGKGPRYAAARHLALLSWSRIGKAMETAEGSEFKHGRSGAVNYGDNFFNVWSRKGTPDWGDDKKTVINELVPRVADYPYPVFRDQEPGLIALLAAEDPNDEYLVHLNEEDYQRLRHQRRASSQEEGSETTRPDVVFVTPHGGYLEHLTLNHMLVRGMETALKESLLEKETTWEALMPRTVIMNVDLGESLPGKQGLYKAMRQNFDDRSQIMTITTAGNRLASSHSDKLITSSHPDAIPFLVIGHQLTTQLVEARFGLIRKWLVDLNHALQKEIDKGSEGVIGRFAPQITTPGELMMEWALQTDGPYRAVQEFARSNPSYKDLEDTLIKILDYYNLDPVGAIGAASNLNELNHATTDLIARLAKVVTNASSIRVANPASSEPVLLAFMPLGAKEAEEISFQAVVAQLAGDSEAVSQMRDILADVLGPDSLKGVDDAQQLVAAFIDFATPRLLEAVNLVQEWRPDAPGGLRVVLHVHGDRLAHQDDDKLLLNIHGLRHPLLAAQQIEHELGHEVVGPLVDSFTPPQPWLREGVTDRELLRAMEEGIILSAEAARFSTYTPAQQHEVLEAIQGPNLVDPYGQFDRFIADWGRANETQRIQLVFRSMEESHPHLARAAQALGQAISAGLQVEDALRKVGGQFMQTPFSAIPAVPAPWVDPLRSLLMEKGNRPSEHAGWVIEQYRRYRALKPSGFVSEKFHSQNQPERIYFVSVFPHQQPKGDQPTLTAGIPQRVSEYFQGEGHPEVVLLDQFVRGFRAPDSSEEAVIVVLAFNQNVLEASELKMREGIQRILQPWIKPSAPPTQAGAEEGREKARARGWVEQVNPRTSRPTGFFATPQGGLVAVATDLPRWNVNLDRIDPAAVIHRTARVIGPETVIEAGAQVHGLVENGEVLKNAIQRGELRTVPASKLEEWDPNMLGAKVPSTPNILTIIDGKQVIKAVLEPGTHIQNDRLSITNTRVRSVDDDRYRTILALPGMIKDSEIGIGNRHLGEGMIKVMFPTFFDRLVTVYADKGVVQEFAEARIPMGRTYVGDTHNYVEFVGVNGYVWGEPLAGGSMDPHVVGNLPSVGISLAEIYASFDGTLARKEPRITQLIPKQSSGHWWIGEQSGLISAGATVVGKRHGSLAGVPAETLLARPDVTLAGGFVASEGIVPTTVRPGTLVSHTSPYPSNLEIFKRPEVVWGLVHEAWMQAKRAAVLQEILEPGFDRDGYLRQAASDLAQWPQRMLLTAAAMALQQGEAVTEENMARAAAAMPDMRGATVESLREYFNQIAKTALELHKTYGMEAAPEALDRIPHAYQDAVGFARRLWAGNPLSQKDQMVHKAVSAYPLWRAQDLDSFEMAPDSSRIDSTVVLHPDAVVVGSNKLTGETRLGRGVVVIGSELHDFLHPGVSEEDYKKGVRVFVIDVRVTAGSVGEGTSLHGVIADELVSGKNADLRFSRFERFAIGDNSWASGFYGENSRVGNEAELKTGGHVRNTAAGNKPILGGVLWESTVGDGYVMNHAGAAGFGVVAPNIPVRDAEGNLMGEVPNPTNHSDGVVLGNPGFRRNQVFLHGHVMFAAHTWVNPVTESGFMEAVHLGAGSFVKGMVKVRRVMPLQFFDGRVPAHKAPGSVLDRMGPDYIQFLVGYPLRKADTSQAPLVAHLMPTLIKQAIQEWGVHGASQGVFPAQVQAVQERLSAHLESGHWDTAWNPQANALTLATPLVRTPKGYVFESAQLAAGAEETEQVGDVLFKETAAPAVPALLAQLEAGLGGETSRAPRAGNDLYAPIFADPTGLAVGVSLQFAQSSQGGWMPQRFVVANEAEEQVLKGLLIPSRHSEIVRAWEHGGVEGAILFAQQQLEGSGLLGWPVRDLPTDLSGLLAEVQKLAALLEAGSYDPVFAAKLAQKAYDLFV